MSKSRDKKHADQPAGSGLSRREFFKQGAAAGVGVGAAAMLSGTASAKDGITWKYEADIVILGAGCVGLHAAIRARDLGASVIVIDQNFEPGGRLMHSGGWTSLGGGDAIQERDRLGLDPDNMGLSPPLVPPEVLLDDPDTLFRDTTDWSVVDERGQFPYRYQDREQMRAHADNVAATRKLQIDNYVRFSRIYGTHDGGGMTRARAARSILKVGEVTDIKAGTISPADLGSSREKRSSAFNGKAGAPDLSAASLGAPGWIQGGFTMVRCLEFSAREKGVQFMFNRRMDEIVREHPRQGRVIGVRASYTPRFTPGTQNRLESFWSNGNIDEREETIHIRARRAVIIGTGGYSENPEMRSWFDPRLSDPSVFGQGKALAGPGAGMGTGISAALEIGATMAGLSLGMQQSQGQALAYSTLGVRDLYDALYPGHPIFPFATAYGLRIGDAGFEHVIAVNQVGQRFYNEIELTKGKGTAAKYPAGTSGTRKPFTPGDWRNASIEHVRSSYARYSGTDAALAINEGSQAPHYWSGPVWAIFDQAAVDRGGWDLGYPFVADNGYFFKADTLAELARKVMANENQNMILKYLEETVSRYNGFADAGKDEDFEKPVMHRLETPPYYAALIPITLDDTYGGLSINGKAQVKDTDGKIIPGLYAGGEATGGGAQHGIGRAAVHAYIAATEAMRDTI